MKEYARGQAHSLLTIPFSASFHHMLFSVAANICHLQLGVCLVGVQTQRCVRKTAKRTANPQLQGFRGPTRLFARCARDAIVALRMGHTVMNSRWASFGRRVSCAT